MSEFETEFQDIIEKLKTLNQVELPASLSAQSLFERMDAAPIPLPERSRRTRHWIHAALASAAAIVVVFTAYQAAQFSHKNQMSGAGNPPESSSSTVVAYRSARMPDGGAAAQNEAVPHAEQEALPSAAPPDVPVGNATAPQADQGVAMDMAEDSTQPSADLQAAPESELASGGALTKKEAGDQVTDSVMADSEEEELLMAAPPSPAEPPRVENPNTGL